MAVAILADHDQGRLSPATARVLAAAQALEGEIDVLVIGAEVAGVAEAAAGLPAIRRVRVLDAGDLAEPSAERLAALLGPLAGEYSHMVASAGAVGRDAIPRLAAVLDVMPVTDVVAVHGPRRFDRPIYAGNAIETVATDEPVVLLTVRASAFAAAKEAGESAGVAPIEPLGLETPPALAEFLAAYRTESDSPDLPTAQIVVAGGIALGSSHNFEMIEKLAAVLGAAVGATRAAVDAGYAPNDWQVGQTGKVIAPDLYIAVGISGALQHLAGIQGAKRIVAINADPEAPLMKLADIALVGDLFEIVPELTRALENRLGPR